MNKRYRDEFLQTDVKRTDPNEGLENVRFRYRDVTNIKNLTKLCDRLIVCRKRMDRLIRNWWGKRN